MHQNSQLAGIRPVGGDSGGPASRLGNASPSRPPLEPVKSDISVSRWESAYAAFETPEKELRKFVKRLRRIGASEWDQRLRVLEVFSGRGNGLRAWHALGFSDICGVDLSPTLATAYSGPGRTILGDARALPLRTASKDVVAVQGGLHHLSSEKDVEQALAEIIRVVVPGGKIVLIEPWSTPFLHLVHFVCDQPLARQTSRTIDALATMIEEERVTYRRWLDAPDQHLQLILRYIEPAVLYRRWGKLVIVGSPVRH